MQTQIRFWSGSACSIKDYLAAFLNEMQFVFGIADQAFDWKSEEFPTM